MKTAYIQSIVHAFEVLSLVHEQGEVRLAEVATHFNIKPPTAHNLLRTLVHTEALSKNDEGKYCIGDIIHRMGNGDKNEWSSLAQKCIQELVGKMPWATTLFATVDGFHVRARLRWSHDDQSGVVEPTQQIMNIYASVTGLTHLIFAPEETRLALMDAHPFYEHGERLWGSMNKLDAFAKKSRKLGFVELPFPEPFLRVAVPVYAKNNHFMGSMGCSVRGNMAEDKKIRQTVINELQHITREHFPFTQQNKILK